MSETTPTPNTMPGANPPAPQETPKTEPTPAPKAETAAPAVSAEDKAELERLRAFRKEAQKWEERAKNNFDDAERWRQLSKTVGGDEEKFDPQAEFQKLRDEVTRERTERTRAEVARAEDVDPDVIIGDTEEAMRESAQRYKAKVEAAIEKALKGRAPAAAPASEVTANGKVAGPGQIQSQDELKNMTPKEIMVADSEGRLDHLKGKV
jgi:hypothetical protein